LTFTKPELILSCKVKEMSEKFVQMRIKGLVIDPITRMPIIVLHDEEKENEKILPIWVGIFEANAIAIKIENVESPRPMTHDLLKNTIETLNCKVKQIKIDNLKDNTYYANIILEQNGKDISIDSRPSDAIALALRADSPIMVAHSVLKKAYAKSPADSEGKMKEEDIKKWFENLSPDIMNKYKM